MQGTYCTVLSDEYLLQCLRLGLSANSTSGPSAPTNSSRQRYLHLLELLQAVQELLGQLVEQAIRSICRVCLFGVAPRRLGSEAPCSGASFASLSCLPMAAPGQNTYPTAANSIDRRAVLLCAGTTFPPVREREPFRVELVNAVCARGSYTGQVSAPPGIDVLLGWEHEFQDLSTCVMLILSSTLRSSVFARFALGILLPLLCGRLPSPKPVFK